MDFKLKRKEHYEFTSNRQSDENKAVRERNREIMKKLQRSKNQVEEYMRK